MVAPKSASATFVDLAALPGEVRAEVIRGTIVEKASPSAEHGASQFAMSGVLGRRFGRGPGGRWPGGWWFGTEIEVQYETHEVYLHALVGWRRDRIVDRPVGRPVFSHPDWACELLSPSNAKHDLVDSTALPSGSAASPGQARLVDKFQVVHRSGVPHYWIADPPERVLIVYRWQEAGYLALLTAARRHHGSRRALRAQRAPRRRPLRR